MKKIKILIASMLSAIVLVFAAVFGGNVNADSGHPGTYYWKSSDNAELISDDTTNSYKITFSGHSAIGTSSDIGSNTYDSIVAGKAAISKDDKRIKLDANNNLTLSGIDCKFDLSIAIFKGSKDDTVLSIKKDGETVDSVTMVKVNNAKSYYLYSNEDFDSGSYVITANKAIHIYEILVVQKPAGSIDDLVTAAETAIGNIGTVTYSQGSNTKIILARNAINAVNSAAEDDDYYSTNYADSYATYTAAVNTYNTAETNAKNAFTAAVTAIGTVTASSGSAIETAEDAYDVLFGNALTDSDVVAAKATLDAAKLAYADAIYDTLSKSFSTNDDETITSAEVTLSADQQLGNSIFTATTGIKKKDAAVLSIGSESWNTRYYTGGSSTCSEKTKNRLIYFTAKTSGTLKIAATSQSSTSTGRKVDVYNETYTKFASVSAQISDSNNTYLYVNIPSSGKYYIGSSGDGGVNFFYLEFMPETTYVANDVTLTFDAQYNEEAAADSTKLRFIGTIDGIAYDDYANIDTMKFTFKFNGTDRTVSVNRLYKSIKNGETAIKSAADDTMYVVYQLNNINKTAYQGKALTNCKFIVTFTDGSTVSVNRDDITLPTKFTTVVA